MHPGHVDRQVGREAAAQSMQVTVRNLEEVTTNGDYEVTFHLQRPQPALSVPASGTGLRDMS